MNLGTASKRRFWTNASVLNLTDGDPIDYICSLAARTCLEAMQHGWSGPPYDPTKLAEYFRVRLVPRAEVADARLVPLANGRYQIEYNPNKPRARTRFSIAHELAHLLFPDCGQTIRQRSVPPEQKGDDWQLEMLCNLGAAEFLMPVASFQEAKKEKLNIDRVLQLRQEFDVSTEAVLLRVIRLTDQPCAVFSASNRGGKTHNRYVIDYSVGSRTWEKQLQSGAVLPNSSLVSQCAGIGYTAKGEEEWGSAGSVRIECLGIAPFPGQRLPRVVGFAMPASEEKPKSPSIRFVVGDATTPRGEGQRVVAHIVNDKTPNWGVGFGRAVREAWPEVQREFRSWVGSTPDVLHLGNVHHCRVNKDTVFFQLICQHGYGPSEKPRLRYGALKACLDELSIFVRKNEATVHMPRIGAGQGGGSWGLIQQLIDESLCARGISVTVYDLPPGQRENLERRQRMLFG